MLPPIDDRYPDLSRDSLCEHATRHAGDSGHLNLADEDDLQVLHSDLLDAWVPEGMSWVPGVGSVALWDEHDMSVFVRGTLWESGRRIGSLSRRLNTVASYAEHTYFWMNDDAPEGRHHGGRQMRRSVEAYQRLGVKRASISAMYVGRYVWSRCGFKVEKASERLELATAITQFMVALGRIGATDEVPVLDRPADYLAYNGTEDSPVIVTPTEIQAARDALDADPGVVPTPDRDLPLGNALLLYAPVLGWDCSLDLSQDPDGLRTLDGYTRNV